MDRALGDGSRRRALSGRSGPRALHPVWVGLVTRSREARGSAGTRSEEAVALHRRGGTRCRGRFCTVSFPTVPLSGGVSLASSLDASPEPRDASCRLFPFVPLPSLASSLSRSQQRDTENRKIDRETRRAGRGREAERFREPEGAERRRGGGNRKELADVRHKPMLQRRTSGPARLGPGPHGKACEPIEGSGVAAGCRRAPHPRAGASVSFPAGAGARMRLGQGGQRGEKGWGGGLGGCKPASRPHARARARVGVCSPLDPA